MHPIVAERITKGDGYTLKKALTLVALVSMFALLGWSDAWDKKTILTPLITVEKPTVAQVYKPTPPPPPVAAPEPPRTVEYADRNELPATASSLPALVLAGLLALAAGLALRRVPS